jgi:hypothetical protein
MMASADNTIVSPANEVTDDYGRWQLVQSWITNSMPVSDANGWTTSQTPTFDGNNVCAEFWNKSGASIKQTLDNLPVGSYELIAVAFTRDGMTATLNAGSNTMSIATASTTAANNRGQANTWFNEGNGVNTLEFTHAGGSLEIGLTADNTTGDHWLVWRSFVLIYKGVDLSELKVALQAQIDAVPALQGTTTTAAYNAAKKYADGIDLGTLTTPEAISDASNELASLVDAAKALQADYSRYAAIRDAALAIAPKVVLPDVESATTTAAIDAVISTLRANFLAELPKVTVPTDGIDVTAVMVDNASVRQNTDFWTAVENGSARTSGSWAVCNYNECEFYNNNFKFYQTLALARGTWEFGVTGFHRAGNHSTYFYAGEDKILIPGVESSVVNTMAAAETYFNEGNGKVALKFVIEGNQDVEIGIDNKDTQTDKWTIFRDFTLKYYGAPNYKVYEELWATTVNAANEALDDQAYKYVSGSERTAVTDAIADAPDGSSKANYLEKIQTLETAIADFKAAAPSYNAWVLAKTETQNLWGSALGVTAPKNAAEAVEATHNLNIAQYDKVAKEYPYSLTSKIGDFGTWVCTATVADEPAEANYLNNEHWSGGARAYYEQAATGWGNANGWTVKYEKKCVLPAGDYVIKVAARSSEGTTSLVSCTASDITFGLPNLGAYTRGISVDGKASWSDSDTFARGGDNNEGFGWQWRFLPFTLTEETEVTMTFEAEATTQYQWVSIADGELLSKKDFAESFEFYANKNNNVIDSELANVTIHRDIQAKGYYTVVLPFDAQAAQVADAFGTAVTVYTFDNDAKNEETGKVTVNFKRDYTGTIKANTPVIVYADKSSSEQVFKGVEIVAENPVREGSFFNFEGSYDVNEIFAGDYYLKGGLQDQEGTKVDAFSALFRNITGEVIEDFEVNLGDGTTGIRQLDGRSVSSSAVFNLAGQRVGKAVKGLYIVGGKKVLVK